MSLSVSKLQLQSQHQWMVDRVEFAYQHAALAVQTAMPVGITDEQKADLAAFYVAGRHIGCMAKTKRSHGEFARPDEGARDFIVYTTYQLAASSQAAADFPADGSVQIARRKFSHTHAQRYLSTISDPPPTDLSVLVYRLHTSEGLMDLDNFFIVRCGYVKLWGCKLLF